MKTLMVKKYFAKICLLGLYVLLISSPLYTQVYSLNKRAVYVESPSLQPEPVQTCWNSWFEIVLNQCHHDEYMQHYLEFFEREHTEAQV